MRRLDAHGLADQLVCGRFPLRPLRVCGHARVCMRARVNICIWARARSYRERDRTFFVDVSRTKDKRYLKIRSARWDQYGYG